MVHQSSPLYSAAWVQKPGPTWVGIHGVSASAYQSWFNQYSGQGCISTIVSATGAVGSEVYAGVMEQTSIGPWNQQCGLTSSDLQNQNNGALSIKKILKSFDEYGTPTDRRYCGIWQTSPGVDKASVFTGLLSATYQSTFNSETSKPYWHPAALSISEDMSYSALFTDISIGGWSARHGMTAADLTAESSSQNAVGRYIIHLAAGGSGTNARYAAVFAPQDTPSSRTWRTAGTINGFKNNIGANTQLEDILKSFMQSTGVRQAQLSIGKNGNILLDKSYTWSEPERQSISPSDRFLLASLSKAFDEAVIQKLYDANKLTPTTKVYPLLGYSCTTGDARRCQITVQQLLDHTSGYDNTALGFDPVFNMRNIAIAKSNGQHPATIQEIVSIIFPYNLATNPGATYSYSNYGYLLLSAVVEKVTGQTYLSYLKSSIVAPEGLNVALWGTDPSSHSGDKVIQESRYTGLSALQPLNGNPVAAIYGGDGMYKESAVGPAAISASASSLVKFIRLHGKLTPSSPSFKWRLTIGTAVWGNGGRAPGFARAGSTLGSSTWMQSRTDDVDWALVVNTRDFPHGDDDFTNVNNAVTQWLDTNPTL
jgi:CubicO group peptidase (beta-lactamase class C family)